MTADAMQLPLPLGWYLGICGFVFLACTVVWLCGGAETADRALADLPTDDDEPDRCTHPECEHARQVHRERVRRQLAVIRARGFVAARARVHWSERDDAEFAEFARSHGGA